MTSFRDDVARSFAVPVAMVLLAGGCSGYRLAKLEPPPLRPFGARPVGLSQVCLLRPPDSRAGGTSPVHDNGKLVGALSDATYFCYFAGAGPHMIALGQKGAEAATVKAVSGERYYLDQVAGGKLVVIPEKAARPLVERCTYHVLTQVPGTEQLPRTSLVADAAP